MHISVYIVIPKDEYYGEPLDYLLEEYLRGYDYIDSRTEPIDLDEKSIKILENVMKENIEEYNEHVREIIKVYEEVKDNPEKVYFNADLRHNIDISSTNHVLTHQIYKYRDEMATLLSEAILSLTKEDFEDILRNPEKYILLIYDVHY